MSGALHSIKRIAFPAMVAGDDNRAAFAFLGTANDGEALGSGAGFEGTWQLYVSTTYDGGATWVTVNATGDDPVQRGNVCDAGLSCPTAPDTRNLLDFMDVQIDARGRILVGYADGCVSPGSSPAWTRTAMASWTRATMTRRTKPLSPGSRADADCSRSSIQPCRPRPRRRS